jgi:hypothetical protein
MKAVSKYVWYIRSLFARKHGAASQRTVTFMCFISSAKIVHRMKEKLKPFPASWVPSHEDMYGEVATPLSSAYCKPWQQMDVSG